MAADTEIKPRVLVVEDAPNWMTLYTALLQDVADVIPATSVVEAQKRIAEGAITHIIADSFGTDCLDLLETAREAKIDNLLVISGIEIGKSILKKAVESRGSLFVTKDQVRGLRGDQLLNLATAGVHRHFVIPGFTEDGQASA